jgi:beta-glucosidase-like glycosyl hydrolase
LIPTSLAPDCDAPLRDKLAQLMIVRLGSNMAPIRTAEEDERRIAELLGRAPLGGLVVFNGSMAGTPPVLARLQAASRYPLLVGADLERGVGQHLAGWPIFPHAKAFERLGDDASSAVREYCRLTAAASRAAGVQVVFAPVADVDSDPRNPIIATRAFSSDPAAAAALTATMVEAFRQGGVLTAAKHFPGHGDTHEDSHDRLPCVELARSQLERRELTPFRAAIAADVPLVMTAHVRYPALDPTGTQGTLSKPILVDLLRGELGFRGAVVSDSLLMEGARVGCRSAGEMLVRAVAAGVDLLLDVPDPLLALDALEAAVLAGELSENRVDEALGRVRALKEAARTGAPGDAAYDADENYRRSETMALSIARRAVHVVAGDPAAVPLDAAASLAAVLVNPYVEPRRDAPQPWGQALANRFGRLSYFELGASPSSEEFEAAAEAVLSCEQFVAAIVVKPAAWRRFGLPTTTADWLRGLFERRRGVVACMGVAQGLEPFSAATASVCTLSDVSASQAALADFLAGVS